MWPPGHLAVGYLLYSFDRRSGGSGSPSSTATVALALGTQFPDLVDKPLSWSLGLLPTGRSLAHSLVVAAVVSAVVLWSVRTAGHAVLARAFVVGYGSHLLADVYAAVVAGPEENLRFLFWPIVSQEEYATSPSFRSYAAMVGWRGLALVACIVGVAAAAATLTKRLETRPFIGVVFAVVAITAAAFLAVGIGSAGIVVELIVVQAAAAAWIRDGAPGVPRLRG